MPRTKCVEADGIVTDAKTDIEWDKFRREVAGTITLIGSLIFFPAILLLGIAHGIRAGLIEGMSRTLSTYRAWNR